MPLPSPLNQPSLKKLPATTKKSAGFGQRAKSIAKRVKGEVDLYRSIATHPRTPFVSKALLVGAVAYVVSPIDLIPDFLPAVGWLDDIIVVPALAWLALEMVPNDVIEECRDRQKASNHPPDKV